MSYGTPQFGDSFGEPVTPQFVGPPKSSGKATASLVLGVLSFVTCLLTGIPAVIFGALALRDINRSQGQLGGNGMAIAGIITGGLGTLASVLMIAMVAMWVPGISSMRGLFHMGHTTAYMKVIGDAVAAYKNEHAGELPADSMTPDGKPLLSWRVAILPYMDQKALYDQFHHNEPWDSPHNRKLLAKIPKVFEPADSPTKVDGDGVTCLLRPVGAGTVFDPAVEPKLRGKRIDAQRQKTTIALVSAENDAAVEWTRPGDLAVDLRKPQRGLRQHAGMVWLFLMADGNVQPLDPKQVNDDALRAMFTSGEVQLNLPGRN